MKSPAERVTRAALFVTLALGAWLAPASAEAAPSLSWSGPMPFDSGMNPSAISCVSESLCVAVDGKGDALSTLDPTAAPPTWSSAAIDPGESLNAVSCNPGGMCAAVDGRGYAFVSFEPGASAWLPVSIDSGRALTGVSCPTASLCVAVDESGNLLASGSPGSGGWTLAAIDPGHRLAAVSCSSPSLCVAVDDAGRVLSSVSPAAGAGAWHAQKIESGELLSVSCSAAGACVAGAATGDVLASADPGPPASTWSVTPIDGERLASISCASTGLCVAGDGRGEALASDDPAAPIPAWIPFGVDSTALAGISCLPGGFCMAVDAAGRALTARVSPPAATTLAPTEVTAASATLAGAVNPNDAVLGACSFEYGTGVPYTQSIPCSVLPAATGGVQGVSAQLSGLSANTTYHYRVLASSPAGTTAGADVAFTTAVSSQIPLVLPHPSITGTPAVGQRLTCHPGIEAGAQVRLAYAWVRDLIPIPLATAFAYSVKGQDAGHHLQCQVTATDGGGSASAKTAFVTVPVEGVPASTGETFVGRATFSRRRLRVPIICSTLAGGGCRITLRLTVVETLSGARIVGLAARWRPSAHPSAATRHRTVTLAGVRAHLASGAHTTVVAALNANGRHLLATRRRFTASLSVSGTVIGVIESQLAQQLVTLGASSRSASSHGAHRH